MAGFTAAVARVLGGLEQGDIITYGEVAAEAGHPGAARAVGRVLRDLTDVPWWRVVTTRGRVCPHAVDEATRRLAEEGVRVMGGYVVGRG